LCKYLNVTPVSFHGFIYGFICGFVGRARVPIPPAGFLRLLVCYWPVAAF